MNVFERVMRVMAHTNIGASAGIASWVLWSGWLAVIGPITPACLAAEVKALMGTVHTGEPCAMQLAPVEASAAALVLSHSERSASQRPTVVLREADL